MSSSISNPDRNINNINPNIANPDINSEILTIPKTGPTSIPYAISKTILGMLILCAISGNKKAPKEIITRDKASKFSIN